MNTCMYCGKLKAKIEDSDPDNMTVETLMRSKPKLAKEIAMAVALKADDKILG